MIDEKIIETMILIRPDVRKFRARAKFWNSCNVVRVTIGLMNFVFWMLWNVRFETIIRVVLFFWKTSIKLSQRTPLFRRTEKRLWLKIFRQNLNRETCNSDFCLNLIILKNCYVRIDTTTTRSKIDEKNDWRAEMMDEISKKWLTRTVWR